MHEASMLVGQTARPGMDDHRGPLLIGMSAGFLAFTLVFVVLRVYVRAFLIKKWGPDDSLVVISYVSTTAGLGKHVWALPLDDEQGSRRIKLVISATLSYQITFIVIKMAFLLQFRRVFVLPKFVLFCDIMLGFISIFGIAIVVSSIIFNTPRWRGEPNAQERYDQGVWWLATGSVHLVTDIIIFFMPIPMLNMLKLKPMQKAALFISFGLGFVTTCISIVRMSTLPHVFTKDVTWDVIPALVWSEVELCCAVICLCIPTLRPLLQFKKLSRTQYSYDHRTSGASAKARFNRKTFNGGTFGSHSQQSLPSPMFMDIEPGMELSTEPKTPSSEPYNENRLTIMADVSPALTAGESDDEVSEDFGPVDVEVATPLSPPPQCFVSPARLLHRSRPLSESVVEE
ncbi:integral membrane protein [Colletotrichum tofieldiae]|uniref:Integral membrane protein n=1 Tax=Colletotrichum tofieldiae TaxID=708197 RepID=A0A166XP33_9PEZI|nr:integral membrane protein [Colletotrichum tofieldiae]